MRCLTCSEEYDDSEFMRHKGPIVYRVSFCHKCIERKKRTTRHKRVVQSEYKSRLADLGYVTKQTIWGVELKILNMEFTLVSLADKVSEPINYRKLGFEVSDDGVITSKEIEVETDSNLTLKGLNRKDVIEKIKKLTGFPVVIGGDVWTIKNQ